MIPEYKGRIQHKNDIEANWKLATNFTPLKGEIIIYNADEITPYKRLKIGDGKSNVNDLPFVIDSADNRIASVAITATLLASAWSSGQQTITVSDLGATQNGIASLPQNCSDSEYEAVCAAGLMVTSQSAGSLTFSANGEVPQIDIPILIILLA